MHLRFSFSNDAVCSHAFTHSDLLKKDCRHSNLLIFPLTSANVFYMHIQSVMVCVSHLLIFTAFYLFVLFILEKMLQRYGSLSGKLHMIELEKDPAAHGLGISLSGNKDDSRARLSIYVAYIDPKGPASLDGRIMLGDELLEVGETINWQD